MHVGMCLYNVLNNMGTVLDHPGVFSNTVHQHRREFSCA
jgi:hypothetical protein